MDNAVEVINAVSALWKLGLVVTVLVLGIIYRERIGGFFDRLTNWRVKRGNLEVEADLTSQPEATLSETLGKKPGGTDTPPAEQPCEVDGEARELEMTGFDNQRDTMLIHFIERDIEKGEKAFADLMASEATVEEKKEADLLHSYSRYRYANDSVAINKLVAVDSEEANYSYAQKLLALAFEASGEFDQASKAYERATGKCEVPEKRARLTVRLAKCLLKAGRKREAFSKMTCLLATEDDRNARKTVFTGLAELYENAGDEELRSLALEKALDCQPDDAEIRFSAAYSHSQLDRHLLSLFHYDTFLRFSPDHGTVLNNIGVVCAELKMAFRRMAFFKKAIAKDETLAMANLAGHYIEAGLEQEARELLEKARTCTEVHPNVGSAMAQLSRRSEEEEKVWETSLESACKQRSFLSKFGEAFFQQVEQPISLAGKWRTASGQELDFSQKGDRITSGWISEGDELHGRITNTAVRLDLRIQTKTVLGNVSYEKKKAYGYLGADRATLYVMVLEETGRPFVELSRSHETLTQ